MNEKFDLYRSKISSFLSELLNEKKSEAKKVNEFGEDLPERLVKFILGGKMIRGCLVLLAHEMFKEEVDDEAVKVGAAIELLHSALLIHDDIIDKDELRRGDKTIFAQYEELGVKENFPDARHFGYSMAVCVGDLCISYAYQILSNLNVDDARKRRIISLFCDSLNCAGLAEMDDIYLSFTKKEFSEERVMNVYKYKTAIYTFSVPFTAGAVLANSDENDIKTLYELGEKIGIIFQIKDDEIGIFGDEESIGKSVGSDVSENKKTLWRNYLFEKSSDEERLKLENIFGKSDLKRDDIDLVRKMILEKNVKDLVDNKIKKLFEESENLIESLNISEDYKKFLHGLMKYNISRNK